MTYKERIEKMVLLSLKKRMLKGDLITGFKYKKDLLIENGARLFSVSLETGQEARGLNCNKGNFKRDVGKNFLIIKVIKQ